MTESKKMNIVAEFDIVSFYEMISRLKGFINDLKGSSLEIMKNGALCIDEYGAVSMRVAYVYDATCCIRVDFCGTVCAYQTSKDILLDLVRISKQIPNLKQLLSYGDAIYLYANEERWKLSCGEKWTIEGDIVECAAYPTIPDSIELIENPKNKSVALFRDVDIKFWSKCIANHAAENYKRQKFECVYIQIGEKGVGDIVSTNGLSLVRYQLFPDYYQNGNSYCASISAHVLKNIEKLSRIWKKTDRWEGASLEFIEMEKKEWEEGIKTIDKLILTIPEDDKYGLSISLAINGSHMKDGFSYPDFTKVFPSFGVSDPYIFVGVDDIALIHSMFKSFVTKRDPQKTYLVFKRPIGGSYDEIELKCYFEKNEIGTIKMRGDLKDAYYICIGYDVFKHCCDSLSPYYDGSECVQMSIIDADSPIEFSLRNSKADGMRIIGMPRLWK